MSELLILKWGTLKGWDLEGELTMSLLEKYHQDPVATGAMQQRDTTRQKRILCELIDAIDGEIINDWTNEILSKDEAKQYINEYGAR